RALRRSVCLTVPPAPPLVRAPLRDALPISGGIYRDRRLDRVSAGYAGDVGVARGPARRLGDPLGRKRPDLAAGRCGLDRVPRWLDRKTTRLNSRHFPTSYPPFRLNTPPHPP